MTSISASWGVGELAARAQLVARTDVEKISVDGTYRRDAVVT